MKITDTQSTSNFFKQLVDSLEGYSIISLNTKGVITSWSSGAVNMFGYTEQEVLGKPVSILFTPEYIKSKKFDLKLLKAQKEGMAEDEKWYVKKDGQALWGKGRLFPLKNDSGELTGYTKILRDLTELQTNSKSRIEANLKFLSEASKFLSSSLDYQTTLNGVTALAVPHIADWCAVDMVNEKGEIELLAISHVDPDKVKWAKELRKKTPPDITAPTGLPNVLRTGKSEMYPHITEEIIIKAAKNKEELELLRKIGFTSVMIVPICIEAKCVGAITFVNSESKRDYTPADLNMAEELGSRAAMAIENAQLYKSAQQELTFRKKIEDDLRQSEKKFKAIFDANVIGVIFSDFTGHVNEANDAFLQIIGYSKADLKKGKININDLTPIEYKSADQKANRELVKTGVVKSWEKELIKKDGSQIPVIIGAALLNKETTETISVILDITERKKLEQRKDEFIGIASHELKTPLTSIKGYIQILERIIEQMGDEKLTTYLKKTNTYIDRLNSLIADLLDVSKIQAGKLQMNSTEFSFDGLVDDSIESIQHLDTHHKIIKKGSVSQKISGDRHRLEQVFTNILSNAIKYSPESNKVIVQVTKDSNDIKVAIQDYGVGIPKSKISKLFDRFYRVEETAKKFSGLGIGLYISYEIIMRHNGKMWVNSQEGKGSTFYFTLPIKH